MREGLQFPAPWRPRRPTASPGMETEPMGAIASLPCLGPGITDAQRKAEGAMCPAWWQAHPPVCGGS